jgi:hypothetical protein
MAGELLDNRMTLPKYLVFCNREVPPALQTHPPRAMTEMSLATKAMFSGLLLESENVGKDGEGSTWIAETNGTVSGKGPDHQMRCFHVGLGRGLDYGGKRILRRDLPSLS